MSRIHFERKDFQEFKKKDYLSGNGFWTNSIGFYKGDLVQLETLKEEEDRLRGHVLFLSKKKVFWKSKGVPEKVVARNDFDPLTEESFLAYCTNQERMNMPRSSPMDDALVQSQMIARAISLGYEVDCFDGMGFIQSNERIPNYWRNPPKKELEDIFEQVEAPPPGFKKHFLFSGSGGAAGGVKRKRGRPKGSKNKPKSVVGVGSSTVFVPPGPARKRRAFAVLFRLGASWVRFEDPTGTFQGWKLVGKRRMGGHTMGHVDKYWVAPDGKVLRSERQARLYLKEPKSVTDKSSITIPKNLLYAAVAL